MSLLLQLIELPTSKVRSEQLQTAQHTLLKSDESAYSTVPSRMSISSSARDSYFSVESAELIHHRWSFEGDLLGARLYKRNYAKKSYHFSSLFESGESQRRPTYYLSERWDQHYWGRCT